MTHLSQTINKLKKGSGCKFKLTVLLIYKFFSKRSLGGTCEIKCLKKKVKITEKSSIKPSVSYQSRGGLLKY